MINGARTRAFFSYSFKLVTDGTFAQSLFMGRSSLEINEARLSDVKYVSCYYQSNAEGFFTHFFSEIGKRLKKLS